MRRESGLVRFIRWVGDRWWWFTLLAFVFAMFSIAFAVVGR